MRSAVFTFALLMGHVAQAQVPGILSYQGRLLNADGSPVVGQTSVTFRIYDAPTGGAAPLWTETQTLTLSDGYYAAYLGEKTPLSADLLNGAERYLELKIGNSESALSPRQRLGSVPYALACNSLEGGTVNATSLQVSGTGRVGGNFTVGGDTLALTGSNVKAPQLVTAGPALFYFHEAEELPVNNRGTANNAVIIADATASGAKAYSLTGTALIFGPYAALPIGNYRAAFRAKVPDNSYEDAAFSLTAFSGSAVLDWTATRLVRGSDFHGANQWQTFSFAFSLKAAISDLEIYLDVKNHPVIVDYLMIAPDLDTAGGGPWKWGSQLNTTWQGTTSSRRFEDTPLKASFVLPRDSWVEARAYGSIFAAPESSGTGQHVLVRVSIDNDNDSPDHVTNTTGVWHTGFACGRWIKLAAGAHTATLQAVASAGYAARLDGNDTVTLIVEANAAP